MKKFLLLILSVLLLTACASTNSVVTTKDDSQTTTINTDTLEEKPITGVDPLWNEPLGYYNISPSAMKVSETEIIFMLTKQKKYYHLLKQRKIIFYLVLVDLENH